MEEDDGPSIRIQCPSATLLNIEDKREVAGREYAQMCRIVTLRYAMIEEVFYSIDSRGWRRKIAESPSLVHYSSLSCCNQTLWLSKKQRT